MECPPVIFNVSKPWSAPYSMFDSNTCVKVLLVVLFQALPQWPYPLSLLCAVVMYSDVVRCRFKSRAFEPWFLLGPTD